MAFDQESLCPVSAPERIGSLDIIRGLALFGVLQVNLVFMSGDVYRLWADIAFPAGFGGLALSWIRDHFITGKAIATFSMLFGVGLCIQMERARDRGRGFAGFAFRRLGALALLGVAHATLLWNGDILLDYALVGMVLLPFLRCRPRTLLAAAGAGFLLEAYQMKWIPLVHLPATFTLNHWSRQADWLMQAANRAYGHGAWLEATRWRIWEWNHLYRAIQLISLVGCLPLFLLGLALWRAGLFQAPIARIRAIRRIFHGVFWVGLALNLVPMALFLRLPKVLSHILFTVGTPCLALGYVMGALLLLQRPWAARRLKVFAPLGRMALTCYLMQSVVGTWVFNAHGLGLWGRVSPAAYFLGGLAFYAAQIAFCHGWLARFRFGPAEWLWRSMTYGRLQPFLLRPRGRQLRL